MKKIIIVEDDKLLGKVYQSKLSLKGYKSELIGRKLNAFSRIKEVKPDLVILDLVLPDGDGFEILEEIRNDKELENMKVFILSKVAGDYDNMRGKKLKVNEYFVKQEVVFDDVIERILAAVGL